MRPPLRIASLANRWIASQRELVQLRSDPLRALLEAQRSKGDVARFNMGALAFYLVNDSEAVRQVLVSDADSYIKGGSYDQLRLVLGESLSTANGEAWRSRRERIQPAFHKSRMDAAVGEMARECARQSQLWSALPDGAAVELHEVMIDLAFRMTARALFGVELDRSHPIGRVSLVLNRFLRARSRAPIKLPLRVPTPRNLEFLHARRALERIVREILSRHERLAPRDDVLAWTLEAHCSGRETTARVADEVLNLLGAGMETGNILSFAWVLLSRNPAVHRRMLDEIDSVLSGREPTADDLARLTYTEQVVQEAMRLFPAVWLFARTPTRDVTLGGVDVAAGSLVGISPWTLHRHPAHWDNPEGFDPDRFAAGSGERRSRFAYLPFGSGPRACIGARLAMIEAKLILASLSRHHRPTLLPGHPIELEASFMLRPKHGVMAELHKR